MWRWTGASKRLWPMKKRNKNPLLFFKNLLTNPETYVIIKPSNEGGRNDDEGLSGLVFQP